MRLMIILSLALNIAVLVPVCLGLIRDMGWVGDAYGAASPARQVLLSVYLSILCVSALLLILQDPKLVVALLLVQVVYKLITPIAVGTLANPVVISNLGIAAFHTVTLLMTWRVTKG